MKPFVVRSNTPGVPPPTPISNVQNAQQIDQFAVRPDRQFNYQINLDQANPYYRITGTKIMITKIFRSAEIPASAGQGWRFFTFNTQTMATENYIWAARLGATSNVTKNELSLDFNPPLFIDLHNGASTFQIDAYNLQAADDVYLAIFGFIVD